MARFEVFIPAVEPDGLNLTLRVTADTWMAALKIGLKKIGQGSVPVRDILCDIHEDESIHVTDPRSGKVFRIVEIPEVSDPGVAAQPISALPRPGAVAPAPFELAYPEASPPPAPARPAPVQAAASGLPVQISASAAPAQVAASAQAVPALPQAAAAPVTLTYAQPAPLAQPVAPPPVQAPPAPAPAAPAKPVVPAPPEPPLAPSPAAARAPAPPAKSPAALPHDTAPGEKPAQPTMPAAPAPSAPELKLHRRVPAPLEAPPRKPAPIKVVEVPAPKKAPPKQIGRPGDASSVEDVLIELFDKTPAVFEKGREDALYFLLDLAMEKIPADSGSIYVADLNRRDLAFAAARGPKSKELLALGLRVPMGRGFVGFCAQEGVAVAISDAQRDPRFFKEISERLGYETRSVLTTPIIAGGRTLGAMQLINKKGSSSFTHGELSILHYMAHQAALYLEVDE